MITETDLPRTRGASSLRAIIERLPDGIVVVDGHGTIRFANPAAERLFDRSAEDLCGTAFGFPVMVGETTEIDILQRGGGGVVFAELRVVETDWEGEQVQLVSLRDITDRKQAEERAQQLVCEREARLEAEAASRAKSEFLAIMSHELRTPLNAVLGYSELMELGISGPVTDKMREQIGRIRMSGIHLLGLVNDILDLAKVEAGRLQVSSGPASAEGAVAAAVALIQPQAASRGLELTIAPASPSIIYRGDEERVRQILVNLLSNAVKFTSPGGKIALEIAGSRTPGTDTRLSARTTYVTFRVVDTGAGIPAEKLVSIFDPFVQAESGHSRSREGSGLGLTISRRLARLMGGDLTVKSEVGKGSTFTLWLPSDLSSIEDAAPAPTIAGQSVALHREVDGLGNVGRALLNSIEQTVEAIVDRIVSDPNLNVAAGLKFSQLADHLAALLADVGGALMVMEESKGLPSQTLADAVEIQRLISERHGAQRQRLGWSESVLRREFMIVREELERVIREASEFGDPLPIDDGVAVVGRFLDQAEYIAVRALNSGAR